MGQPRRYSGAKCTNSVTAADEMCSGGKHNYCLLRRRSRTGGHLGGRGVGEADDNGRMAVFGVVGSRIRLCVVSCGCEVGCEV